MQRDYKMNDIRSKKDAELITDMAERGSREHAELFIEMIKPLLISFGAHMYCDGYMGVMERLEKNRKEADK